MRHSIHGTSSHFMNRFRVPLTMLVGVVILGGATVFAKEPPKKNTSRKNAVTRGFHLPPPPDPQQALADPPGVARPPYPAFIPHSSAAGDDLVLQKEIAKILCDQAKPYPGRAEHFNWLANDPLFQKAVYQVHGLSGYILEAKRLPHGGWLARVSVRPSVSANGLALFQDFILEDYRYQNGVLTLVRTDAAIPHPDKQFLILHH